GPVRRASAEELAHAAADRDVFTGPPGVPRRREPYLRHRGGGPDPRRGGARRRERHPPAADGHGPGGPLPDRRGAPTGRHPLQIAPAERGRAPQVAREYDYL